LRIRVWAAYGSGVSAARIANTSAAFLVTGPGAADSAWPSTQRIACTSLVVPVRNASSASASADSGTSYSDAPAHSMTRALVTPARHPADSGGVMSRPSETMNTFVPVPSQRFPAVFAKIASLPPCSFA
jgi:hypothetical protein